jgi:hypothetical protein
MAVFSKLFYLAIFAGIAFACCYAMFLVRKNNDRLPPECTTFERFYPAAFKRQAIWLGIAAIVEILGGLGFGMIVLIFAIAPWLGFDPRGPAPDAKTDGEK